MTLQVQRNTAVLNSQDCEDSMTDSFVYNGAQIMLSSRFLAIYINLSISQGVCYRLKEIHLYKLKLFIKSFNLERFPTPPTLSQCPIFLEGYFMPVTASVLMQVSTIDLAFKTRRISPIITQTGRKIMPGTERNQDKENIQAPSFSIQQFDLRISFNLYAQVFHL